MATLNNLTTQYNYKLQGIGYQDQANLDSSEAGFATSAGMLNAVGGVAGAASKAYQQGMFSNGGTQIPGVFSPQPGGDYGQAAVW